MRFRGETIHTSAGEPIKDGTIVIRDGKISSIGSSDEITIPDGFRVLEAKVVTPGLIDSHCTIGLSGILNQPHDQDQLESSSPIQPELRAIDAYNAHDPLVAWVRSFGVTTIHTGHAPGELISGQTMVAKTVGNTVEEAVMVETCSVAATLSRSARKSGGSSPGTRGKMISMLRSVLLQAKDYAAKHAGSTDTESDADDEDDDSEPPRDLKLELLARVVSGEVPLMITAHKAQDIDSAMRLADEFDLKIWLDGATESYLLKDRIRAAEIPVIVHPTMMRAAGEQENASLETASILAGEGILVTMQAGYEAYVPKTRVVLFEAAMRQPTECRLNKHFVPLRSTPQSCWVWTIESARWPLAKTVTWLCLTATPFEYTSHCIGVVIDGEVVSESQR